MNAPSFGRVKKGPLPKGFTGRPGTASQSRGHGSFSRTFHAPQVTECMARLLRGLLLRPGLPRTVILFVIRMSFMYNSKRFIFSAVPQAPSIPDQPEETMKKLIPLLLAIVLCTCAAGASALVNYLSWASDTGVLTMLNFSEDQMVSYLLSVRLAILQMKKDNNAGYAFSNGDSDLVVTVTYYDTLDTLIMALEAGEISTMIINSTTADYLCATSEGLFRMIDLPEKTSSPFAQRMRDGILSNDYAFMMLETNKALRDEFDAAISDMKADGTLEKLVREQITEFTGGGMISPVKMPVIQGAKTLKVAVTGSLPPMDYVSPDGTPAGFNTAVLAEISRRIGKNIQMVVLDSIGRSSALASGAVDAVFWARTNSLARELAALSDESYDERMLSLESGMSEEEVSVFRKILTLVDVQYALGQQDTPEEAILTGSYYTDHISAVVSKDHPDAPRAFAGK